jgi:hypothetical protein
MLSLVYPPLEFLTGEAESTAPLSRGKEREVGGRGSADRWVTMSAAQGKRKGRVNRWAAAGGRRWAGRPAGPKGR